MMSIIVERQLVEIVMGRKKQRKRHLHWRLLPWRGTRNTSSVMSSFRSLSTMLGIQSSLFPW
ncbi:hypothetical protein MAR_021789 [Mya arenaria]|uniref:Uncharacterized protein n=1 Tax=Mya arenaria TaxID=6604 RepID=A0ABY7E9A5_MYAAR|nr:hypothetical protein MAR_021789 [Mya arenaria]